MEFRRVYHHTHLLLFFTGRVQESLPPNTPPSLLHRWSSGEFTITHISFSSSQLEFRRVYHHTHTSFSSSQVEFRTVYHHTHLLLFFTAGVQESVPPHTPPSLLHRWSSGEFTTTHTSFSSSQVKFRRVYHHTHLLLFFTVGVQESLPPHTPPSLLHRWSSGEFTTTHTSFSFSQVEFRRVYHHTHLLLFFTVRVQESLPSHTPPSFLHSWSSGECTTTHTSFSSSQLEFRRVYHHTHLLLFFTVGVQESLPPHTAHLLLFFTVGVQESLPPHTPPSLLHSWSSGEFTTTHTSFSSSQLEFKRVYHHTHLLLFFTVRVQESLPSHTPPSLPHSWSLGEFTITHTSFSPSQVEFRRVYHHTHTSPPLSPSQVEFRRVYHHTHLLLFFTVGVQESLPSHTPPSLLHS